MVYTSNSTFGPELGDVGGKSREFGDDDLEDEEESGFSLLASVAADTNVGGIATTYPGVTFEWYVVKTLVSQFLVESSNASDPTASILLSISSASITSTVFVSVFE